MAFRRCIACQNNSVDEPEKIFLRVPKNAERASRWAEALNRARLPAKSCVCEDHFDMANDFVNFFRYKTFGDVRLVLKPFVAPHRNLAGDISLEKFRKNLAGDARLGALEAVFLIEEEAEARPSSSLESRDAALGRSEAQNSPSLKVTARKGQKLAFVPTMKRVTEELKVAGLPSIEKPVPDPPSYIPSEHPEITFKQCLVYACTNDTNKQPNKVFFTLPTCSMQRARWVAALRCLAMPNRHLFACCEDHFYLDVDCMNWDKFKRDRAKNDLMLRTEAVPHRFLVEAPLFPLLSQVSDDQSEVGKNAKIVYLYHNQALPHETTKMVEYLTKRTKLDPGVILLTIKKITQNDTFARLGCDFGLDSYNVMNHLQIAIPRIAAALKKLIFLPHAAKRAQPIIDCFEVLCVENATNRGEKYIISCTKSGFISFISDGVSNRSATNQMLGVCRATHFLSNGIYVVADGGFNSGGKRTKTRKLCNLLKRSKGTKRLRRDRRNVGLCVPIQRVLNELRQFDMLNWVEESMMEYLDYIVVIACGLLNSQKL